MTAGDSTKRILRLHTDLSRVMADSRFDDGRYRGHQLRELAIAYLWARFEGGDKETVWQRTLTLAGLRRPYDPTGQNGLRELYRADAPRYEPPNFHRQHLACPVLMVRGPRVGQACGRPTNLSGRITDIETGEWTIVGWCSRHRLEGMHALQEERSVRPRREPFPNTGGLLPCHIAATNWPDIYRSGDPAWVPPAVGIRADDWPILTRVQEQQRPRFESIDGDHETTGTVAAVPRLQLVR